MIGRACLGAIGGCGYVPFSNRKNVTTPFALIVHRCLTSRRSTIEFHGGNLPRSFLILFFIVWTGRSTSGACVIPTWKRRRESACQLVQTWRLSYFPHRTRAICGGSTTKAFLRNISWAVYNRIFVRIENLLSKVHLTRRFWQRCALRVAINVGFCFCDDVICHICDFQMTSSLRLRKWITSLFLCFDDFDSNDCNLENIPAL